MLLAVSGDGVALLKPFIGSVRAYASGLMFERPPQAVARDLDDVRVVEIPWLLTPNAAEFNGLPRRDFDSAALARLYALGLDAFRIAAGVQRRAAERISSSTAPPATCRLRRDDSSFAKGSSPSTATASSSRSNLRR